MVSLIVKTCCCCQSILHSLLAHRPPQTANRNAGEVHHARRSFTSNPSDVTISLPLSTPPHNHHPRPTQPAMLRPTTFRPLLRAATNAPRVAAVRAYASKQPSPSVDNVPANDPNPKAPAPNVSATNAVPTSSEGSFDQVLQESVEQAEALRTQQAPNRQVTWSRSQNPRERAMVGPRFEQTIMADQVRFIACLHWEEREGGGQRKWRSWTRRGRVGSEGHWNAI